MWLDQQTLALGRGYRTNAEAHRLLAEILAAEGVRTVSFDLPHAGGRAEVLHLMSVVSLVAEDLAVVNERLTPVPLMEALEERGIARIAVSSADYDRLGSNVLAVRPRHAVIFSGVPRVVADLRAAGVEVTEVDADQIALGTGRADLPDPPAPPGLSPGDHQGRAQAGMSLTMALGVGGQDAVDRPHPAGGPRSASVGLELDAQAHAVLPGDPDQLPECGAPGVAAGDLGVGEMLDVAALAHCCGMPASES